MTDETGAPVNEAGEQTEADSPAEPTIDAAPTIEADPETLAVPVTELRPSLEAILMVADQPLDLVTLASAVDYRVEETGQALAGLAAEYDEQGRGFELRNVAGGWRFYTRDEFASVVEAFVLEGQQARLTQAALETLAVVAYKQPVSRARVSAIRGVNVDGVMRTLLTRGLVEEAGQDGETGANLYRTTTYFLERIGVTDITDLPELAPFLPDMADMEDDLAALAGGSDEAVAAVAVEPSGEAGADESDSDESDSDEPSSDDAAVDEPSRDAGAADQTSTTEQTPPADTTAASDEPVRP